MNHLPSLFPRSIIYALVTLTPNIVTVTCTDPPATWTQDNLTGYTVTWYVQNNRTLDFSEVPQVSIANGTKGAFPQVRRNISSQTELYTLLGQKTHLVPDKRKKNGSLIAGLYIVKYSEGVRLLLR